MAAAPDLHARPTVRFAADLAVHGDRTAILTHDGELTYRELAHRVDEVARRLGDVRRLVLIPGLNELDPVIAYLAALCAGHPVLLVPGDNAAARDSLTSVYDPDVVLRRVGGEWVLHERHPGSIHVLHPDLALLLSTSGSTGSPKLARLSHENVQANAEAIAESLRIEATDRAATTLPIHYCYGLSVLHSHLARGAAVILTDRSVVDPCFWDLFRERRGTTFAAVPYTFELLDRVRFADMALPHLRYVTQAGGRLAPDRVRRYADLGRRRGWDLVVMYGQTEATARMAYLPPALAAERPEAIGVPIPGRRFALEPLPEHPAPDTGELVYEGPNVMLGYAESASDLALGRTTDVLRTGDVARRRSDGLYELLGRRSRFLKVYGVRIELDRVEALFDAHGVAVACVGTDDELVVATEDVRDPAELRHLAMRELRLPPAAVRVCGVPELPRRSTGKPDYRALSELVRRPGDAGAPDHQASPVARTPARAVSRAALRALFAESLDRSDVTDDSTFVGLGGDSLSYVELSLRLEEVLGHLPSDWHTTPIRRLVEAPPAGSRRTRVVETGVALRAAAILLIVGTHAGLFSILGSAHVLIGVAGYNFARFQLTTGGRAERLRRVLASAGRIVVPTVAWIAGASLLTDDYGVANLLLLNAVLGPETWTTQWHFWFVEVLTYILLLLAVLLSSRSLDRLERRHPFGFVLALLAVALVPRYELVDLGVLNTKPVLWLFALGWAAARVAGIWQRLLVTAVTAATVPGFFEDPARDAVILGGLLLLLWAPTVRCPAALHRPAGVLASSSLYIYVTHWQVYPAIAERSPLVALAASVAVGIAYAALVDGVLARLARVRLAARGWFSRTRAVIGEAVARRPRRIATTPTRRKDEAAA